MDHTIMSQVFDVIVVGAGVMGSSTAYKTAKCGLKTLLIEQFDFLHHLGSSHGESRTIRAAYAKDYYSRMVLESSLLWEEAETEIGYKVYFKTNHLEIGPSNSSKLLAIIQSCHRNSIPVRVLTPDEVMTEFSAKFQLPDNWIGVVTEHGGVIKPTKAVAMYQTLALNNKAILKDNIKVTQITKDNQTNEIVVLTSAQETFRCKKCVITAGAWTRKLVEQIRGIVLPIQPLQITVHYWRIKQGHESKFTIEDGFPTFSSHGEPYHMFGTPSLEFPGLVKILIHGGSACEPEERTWEATHVEVDALKEWIQGRFGDVVDWNGPALSQSCMYSMTPDEDFVIDFLGGELGNDVVVAGGFSGHGFKMAPVVGRIVAEMVDRGKAEGVDMTPFTVGRFE